MPFFSVNFFHNNEECVVYFVARGLTVQQITFEAEFAQILRFFFVISFEIYFLKNIFNIGFIELCDFVIFFRHTKHRHILKFPWNEFYCKDA